MQLLDLKSKETQITVHTWAESSFPAQGYGKLLNPEESTLWLPPFSGSVRKALVLQLRGSRGVEEIKK